MLSAWPAGAAAAKTVVLGDITSDANGLNDQGEDLVTDVSTPGSVAEADLRSVAVSPLRNGRGRTIGYRLAVTTTGRPGRIRQTQTSLRYGVIMQVTPDCRYGVYWLRDRAELSSSCNNEVFFRADTPLASRVRGESIVIKVPYRAGPAQMRAGERVEQTFAYSAAAPLGGQELESTDIDNAYTTGSWTLPR